MEILGLAFVAILVIANTFVIGLRAYSMYIRWGNLNVRDEISANLMLVGTVGLSFILCKIFLEALGYA